MIKVENVVLPSPEQWKAIIFGARNPLNSWDKSDSAPCHILKEITDSNKSWRCAGCKNEFIGRPNCVVIGPNDHELVMKLAKAGTDHRKFMRMIDVYLDITAPLYWWKEFDTYKVGTVANSCSTMHKIHAKEFTLDDFSHEHLTPHSLIVLQDIIINLNQYRMWYIDKDDKRTEMSDECYTKYKKDLWWQMIQLLPSSYNQRRTVKLNYEVLANIYKSRRGHKLDEWLEFCKWIESLPYSELITGGRNE